MGDPYREGTGWPKVPIIWRSATVFINLTFVTGAIWLNEEDAVPTDEDEDKSLHIYVVNDRSPYVLDESEGEDFLISWFSWAGLHAEQ